MNLLIPYVYIPGHEDPLFAEYTYADGKSRARRMRSDLHAGDYVFFHNSLRGTKYITAYYIVDRVMDVVAAASDYKIRAKYRNPHLISCMEGDPRVIENRHAILFGDPILSRVLARPLPFTRTLANKLKMDIVFPRHRTETQAIGSATRAWRTLSSKQVKILLREIDRLDTKIQKTAPLRSSEEVTEVLERNIEAYLASTPSVIKKGLKLYARQRTLAEGRSDIIYTNSSGDFIIAEIKLGQIGHAAVTQLHQYMKDYAKQTGKKVRGVLVCAGVLPAYREEIAKLRDITVLVYGWRMQVSQWTR